MEQDFRRRIIKTYERVSLGTKVLVGPMRTIAVLAVCLVLLLAFVAAVSPAGESLVSASKLSGHPSLPSTNSSGQGVPPTGSRIILQSLFGIAFLNNTFYNNTSRIIILPASLKLNLTVVSSNSTGVAFSVDGGRVTVGSPALCPYPYCQYRVFDVTSGQAFLAFLGRLIIQAHAVEVGPGTPFDLFLKGPARLLPPGPTQSSFILFARLFGALSNSKTKIGLLFFVGVKQGDVDMDGQVDVGDMVLVASSMGTSEGQNGYNPYADVNMDGVIDVQDLAIVGASFGATY